MTSEGNLVIPHGWGNKDVISGEYVGDGMDLVLYLVFGSSLERVPITKGGFSSMVRIYKLCVIVCESYNVMESRGWTA